MPLRAPRHAFAYLFAGLLLFAGCDSLPGGANPGDDLPAIQTWILRVEITPDPVAVGDTTCFTAIIADSTDKRGDVSPSDEFEGTVVE